MRVYIPLILMPASSFHHRDFDSAITLFLNLPLDVPTLTVMKLFHTLVQSTVASRHR